MSFCSEHCNFFTDLNGIRASCSASLGYLAPLGPSPVCWEEPSPSARDSGCHPEQPLSESGSCAFVHSFPNWSIDQFSCGSFNGDNQPKQPQHHLPCNELCNGAVGEFCSGRVIMVTLPCLRCLIAVWIAGGDEDLMCEQRFRNWSALSGSLILDIGTQVSLPYCVPAIKCHHYSAMNNMLMPDEYLNSFENQCEMTFLRWIRTLSSLHIEVLPDYCAALVPNNFSNWDSVLKATWVWFDSRVQTFGWLCEETFKRQWEKWEKVTSQGNRLAAFATTAWIDSPSMFRFLLF